MSTKQVVVRAILYDRLNRVLLARRVKRGSEHGKFALIGGRVENETLEEAVIREVKEETGLDIHNLSFIQELTDNSSVENETWRVCYFSGLASGEMILKEDEVEDARFVDKNDIVGLDIGFDHYERIIEFWQSISL